MSLQINSRKRLPRISTAHKLIVLVSIVLVGFAAVGAIYYFSKQQQPEPSPAELPVEEEYAEWFESMYVGNEPNCPENFCISMTINGDLLFHPLLWDNFVTADGDYDFTSLFAAQKQYYERTDLAICNFETPIAALGGPYVGYPVFNIPPQVADATAAVGYHACTTATNHSFDQGGDGIARLTDKLDALNIAHTGSYQTEAASEEPLIMETVGGKLALMGGTVSLNGFTPDYDWQVDRMRDGEMREYDVERMLTKARTARERGANVVVLYLHSVQEYITYADTWQQSAAHELADSGLFDFIYFHGSHSVQPAEKYGDVYIFYGLGNSLTVSAGDPDRAVNDQGLTLRVQFTSADEKQWRVNKISYLPTFNKTGNKYAWCPLADDHPSGFCASEAEDARMYARMVDILYSMNVARDDAVLQPWLISVE
jgi:poly-gamma-glutamate synthesis protein (capsule biosynthesis protein)